MECIPVTEKRQGRKRLRDVESWKKKKTKIAKDSGEVYKTYKGDVVDAKKGVTLTCCCHYHCTSRVNSLPTIIKLSVFVIKPYLIKKFCVGGALNI